MQEEKTQTQVQWWKNKAVWRGLLLVVLGATGGNIDRVDEFLPDTALVGRVDKLEVRVTNLENTMNDQLSKILESLNGKEKDL
jgi:hypothetical protein